LLWQQHPGNRSEYWRIPTVKLSSTVQCRRRPNSPENPYCEAICMFDRRLGRLQRQSWTAFIAADGDEVSSDAIAEWGWPEAVLLERRRLTKCERDCMIRAARSIGAYRVRRDGRMWGRCGPRRRTRFLSCRGQALFCAQLPPGARGSFFKILDRALGLR